MPASLEVNLAVAGGGHNKLVDSGRISSVGPVADAMLSPVLQSGARPGPYVSAEATSWYKADLGAALPRSSVRNDAGLPWNRGSLEIAHAKPSLFATLGVPPPIMAAARKNNLVQCKWKGPKPGWGSELLPRRPEKYALSLGGGKGSHPITETEKAEAIWSPRMREPCLPRKPVNPCESDYQRTFETTTQAHFRMGAGQYK